MEPVSSCCIMIDLCLTRYGDAISANNRCFSALHTCSPLDHSVASTPDTQVDSAPGMPHTGLGTSVPGHLPRPTGCFLFSSPHCPSSRPWPFSVRLEACTLEEADCTRSGGRGCHLRRREAVRSQGGALHRIDPVDDNLVRYHQWVVDAHGRCLIVQVGQGADLSKDCRAGDSR